ncbi:hypothetical protein [Trichothermofontia sp.]
MYYLADPPYFLFLAGLFIGMTSGAAFEGTLKQSVQFWSKNRTTENLTAVRSFKLFFPFLGICLGIGLFLTAGLQIFGFPAELSYLISLPLTLFTAALVWGQLGKILQQLERGGSQALDLDSLS